MSYESEMKYCFHVFNKTTNRYDQKEGSYLDMPLSKCPIEKKMMRAIVERKSFSNLGSNTATAIRWAGDYYVVSMRVWDPDIRKNKQFDIAVGVQGKVPFMFRAPYTNDPTLDTYIDPQWDWKKEKWNYVKEKCDPKHRYSVCYNQSIVHRLDQLQCLTVRERTPVGTTINPKTGRKNKIYASVAKLRIHTLTNEEFDIGDDWFDLLRAAHGLPKLDSAKDRFSQECEEQIDSDEFFRHLTWIPMFKMAWYYRNGTIANESQDNIIKL